MQLSDSSRRFLIRIRFLAVVGGIVLWVATHQIVEITKWSLPSWNHILRNPVASYDERMMSKWGIDYRFPSFVRDHIPPDACFLSPPWAAPWTNQGNILLLAYFLYPRRIYYARSKSQKKIETNKVITHVLVAWGRGKPTDWGTYGWPKFSVNARKFFHLPTVREVFLDDLSIDFFSSDAALKALGKNLISSSHLLENYLSDSAREVNDHRLLEFDRPLEYLSLTYTLNNYDYWTRTVNIPLLDKIVIRARMRANITHSVNLIAEVRYANDKLAVFGSSPNKKQNSWESLSISDLYERAKRYGTARGWNTKKMQITRIGINPGLPLKMPCLERYGVIELERGQGRERELETKVDCVPIFLARGNFYRAKNEINEAIANYQLAALLNPQDAWVHFNLGEMYRKQGKSVRTIEEYQKAIELQPNIAWFHFTLSEVYREENKADLALKSFQRATEIDPLKGLY